MPRLKLILNPAADRGHAAEIEPRLQQIIDEEVARSGSADAYDMEWTRTEHPRHATTLAAERGFDAVVAIGGDGTVHEVVNGLMQIPAEQRPMLGVIPIGSGNDFAHNIGLPADPREAARCIIGMQTRTIDLGQIVDGSGRKEYWNNTLGVGFSGAVNFATRRKTRLRGFAVYLVSVLETIFFKPADLVAAITIDHEQTTTREITMLSICNGGREGGGFPVAPNAVMDDGLLTYTIMRRMGRLRILGFLPIVMMGKHLSFPRWFDNNTARHIAVEADRTMVIHADGEVYGSWDDDVRHIEVAILPGGLRVLHSC